jgi:hypothetical protein
MMGNYTLLLVGLIVVCLMLAGQVWLMLAERNRQQRIEQLEKNLEVLKQTVGALCSSAVGVDRRVNRVERRHRDLEEWQESFENQQSNEPPYTDAIRLVKEGADAEHLIRELGISRDAADLIIMLHGYRGEEELQG